MRTRNYKPPQSIWVCLFFGSLKGNHKENRRPFFWGWIPKERHIHFGTSILEQISSIHSMNPPGSSPKSSRCSGANLPVVQDALPDHAVRGCLASFASTHHHMDGSKPVHVHSRFINRLVDS